MITLTPNAAEQVKKSAEEGGMDHLSLRIAASKNEDGTLNYGMGFDEAKDDDMLFKCEGIEVIVAPEHGPLLKDAVVDFVELNPGEFNFIFMNPNDANYTPPGEADTAGGSCSSGNCGCN